jgi:long-chain acyl-CoA synthetase
MLTHRNVSANVAQAEAWLASALGSRTDHVMVTALPLYHIFALTACGILMARLGPASS